MKIAVQELYNKTGKKIKAVIDITHLKKYNSEAFLVLTDLMKFNEKYVSKSATFGGDEFIIAAQDALLALSGRNNMKYFKTNEEALEWISAE
ncbi:STAS/SEC14 domain-containing protein [Patescibacteria group bacterium]